MAIDPETVGRAIDRRTWRLAFSKELEGSFEADTGASRCRKINQHNYVGIAVYNAFLIGDWLLVHDIFIASLCLHLLIMTPIMGFVIAIIARQPAPWLRESILAGGIVLGVIAILGLMLLSKSPLRSTEHISVVLVVLFATMVQRIRFPYVAAAGLASFALYTAALSGLAQHDPARVSVAVAVFAGVILFSMIGCYNLEYEQRTSYLYALRDRLRNEQLEIISQRDPLTGVGNRRALDIALSSRNLMGSVGATGAVLVCDIDHFKAFNDNHGHLAGDACLRRVAQIIADNCNSAGDGVFRLGGEEFLVLLENTSIAQALSIGERIRNAVEEAAISGGKQGYDVVTISVGVASCPANEGLINAIAEADRALYDAKKSGRNQVHGRRKSNVASVPMLNVA